VEISVNLIDAKSGDIVGSKIFKSESNIVQIDARGALDGYNKALSKIINDMLEWLNTKA